MLKLDSTLFLNDDWGLENEAAKVLYRGVVEPLRGTIGLTDAHTHLSVEQIVSDEPFPNIFRAMVLDTDPRWANRDHYITQMVAKRGVPLSMLVDDQIGDHTKWLHIARVFPELAGNHVYTWAHLELRRVFGINDIISEETADRIWDATYQRLGDKDMRPQGLLKKFNFKVICTTDDPLDDLRYHERPKVEFPELKILPTFRPDKAMNIFKGDEWRSYVKELCEKTGNTLSLDGLVKALRQRHDYFAKHGCVASDHGLFEPYGLDTKETDAEEMFNRYINTQGSTVSADSPDVKKFISYMMHRVCEMNQEKGWVTQIHVGAGRNVNPYILEEFGPDSGGDVSTQNIEIVGNIVPLLGRFCSGRPGQHDLTVVLYSLDPTHYPTIATLSRAFPSVRWGVPWWFNDQKFTIEEQLGYMLQVDAYSNSAGMVFDGRTLISGGPRHELYARAVCNVVGRMYHEGMITGNDAERMVQALCFYNQAKLFGFTK